MNTASGGFSVCFDAAFWQKIDASVSEAKAVIAAMAEHEKMRNDLPRESIEQQVRPRL
jgi:hypothetical protein